MSVSQEDMLYCANVTGRNAEVCQCHRKKCCVVPVSQEEIQYCNSVTGRNAVLCQCHRQKCCVVPVSQEEMYYATVEGRNVALR